MAINPKLLNPGEKVIWSTRTHAKVLVVPTLVLLVTAGVAGYLSSLPDDNQTIWLSVIWGIAAVVIAIWSAWPFLKWWTSTYTVTDRRLTTHQGVVNRSGHDLSLSRISDVSYEKGLVDRVLGCGTLVISDAGDMGIKLHDVPRVQERQRMVADLLYRNDTRQTTKPDDGT